MSQAKEFVIRAEKRTDSGTSNSRRLRRAGKVPAVAYAAGKPGVSLTLEEKAALEVCHHAGLVKIDVQGGKPITALVTDVQFDPVSSAVLHVDFRRVRRDVVIVATVPLTAKGEAAGTHQGGILEQHTHEIELRCLPGDVPEEFVVDVSPLHIGDTISVADLTAPEGIEFASASDLVLFHVMHPSVGEEEEGQEGEAVGEEEPEVIGKGKKEEE